MIVYQYADLHLHTCNSDGSYTPRELMEAAREKGFAAVSITDHDTVSAIDEAIEISREMEIDLLPGVELSCVLDDGQEIHILGYMFDHKNPELVETLDKVRTSRYERAKNIVAKLNELGIGITLEQVEQVAKQSQCLGRLHIAKTMLDNGWVKYLGEAFIKYIGNDGPAFYPKYKLSPKEGIDIIRNAGGIAVLAHPKFLDMDAILPILKDAGLGGLEVFYTGQTDEETERSYDMALKYDLLMTGGSDCHGTNKKDILIGRIKLPMDYVLKLKNFNIQVKHA